MVNAAVNVVMWCAGLLYVGYRMAHDAGWNLAMDCVLLIALIVVALDLVAPLIFKRNKSGGSTV